ncbi:MAG: hypothetical protein V3S55_06170 [Nitrospiraceae bacterium]
MKLTTQQRLVLHYAVNGGHGAGGYDVILCKTVIANNLVKKQLARLSGHSFRGLVYIVVTPAGRAALEAEDA